MKTKTVEQTINFNGVKPSELYDMYLDSKHHGKIVNGKVKISKKVGAKFTVWDDKMGGRNLMLVPGKTVVQSWGTGKKNEEDSVLILSFLKKKSGAQLHMVHTHLPARIANDVDEGWKKYYWTPWKKYLKELKKK